MDEEPSDVGCLSVEIDMTRDALGELLETWRYDLRKQVDEMKYLKAAAIVVGLYFLLRWIYESPGEAGRTTNEKIDEAAEVASNLADRVATFIQALGGSVILVIVLLLIIYLVGKAMK